MPYKPKYFTESEVASADIKEEMWPLLDQLRHNCGWPFFITSGYRDGDPNAHGDREAVDIRLIDPDSRLWKAYGIEPKSYGQQRQILHDKARELGINRIELATHHVHVDISKRLPQNVTFIGVSR